jgi:hypothetical protein
LIAIGDAAFRCVPSSGLERVGLAMRSKRLCKSTSWLLMMETNVPNERSCQPIIISILNESISSIRKIQNFPTNRGTPTINPLAKESRKACSANGLAKEDSLRQGKRLAANEIRSVKEEWLAKRIGLHRKENGWPNKKSLAQPFGLQAKDIRWMKEEWLG